MKTKQWIAGALSGALAAGALAQTGTYASGLLHDPVGGLGGMNVTERRLSACCLGSTGLDGVRVELGTVEGAALGLELDELLPTTGTLQTNWRSSSGNSHGALSLTSHANGSVTVTADFSGLGATAVRTVTFGTDGDIDSDVTTPGPIVAYPTVPNCPDGAVPVWWTAKRWDSNAGQYVYQWVWSCAVGQNLNGNPYPGMRVMTPVLPVGQQDDEEIDALLVTGTDPNELILTHASLQTFGVSSWGTGNAHVQETCGTPPPCLRSDRQLTVSNLGSSGQDGVAFFEDGEVALGSEWSIVTEGTPASGSQTLRVRRREQTGHITLFKRTISPDPGTGHPRVSFDFSGVGAAEYDATFLDALGGPLTTVRFPNNVPWTIEPCASGSVWVDQLPPALSGCFVVMDPLGLSFGPLSGVDRVEFVPVNPTRSFDVGDWVDITSDDAEGTIVVRDVAVVPACPGDADGDRVVGLSDLAEVLSQFGRTGPMLSGDVDHDEDVDLSDLATLLGHFGKSCP